MATKIFYVAQYPLDDKWDGGKFAGTDIQSGGYPWPASLDPFDSRVTHFDDPRHAKDHGSVFGLKVRKVTVSYEIE